MNAVPLEAEKNDVGESFNIPSQKSNKLPQHYHLNVALN